MTILNDSPQKLADNIYLWADSNNNNIGSVVGDDGFVAIDLPMTPAETLQWRSEMAKITDKPLRMIVFTSASRVNTDSIKVLAIQRVNPPAMIQDNGWSQLFSALEASYPHAPETGLPFQVRVEAGLPELTFADKTTYLLNSMSHGNKSPIYIDITHIGGCGPGGSYVTVRDSGVLFVGEHVTLGEPPAFGAGDFDVWLKAINGLPKNKNARLIVPGRGQPGDPNEIGAEIVDFVKALRSTMKKFMNGNHSRENLAKLVSPFVDMYATKRQRDLETAEVARFSARMLTGLEQVYSFLTPAVQTVIV
jgi:hypothetical protein